MFAVVYIPDFSLQAVLRHDPELRARPVGLFDSPAVRAQRNSGDNRRPTSQSDAIPGAAQKSLKGILCELTQAAHEAGVQVGMTPPQALARCPSIQIKSRSPAQEKAAQDILLMVAFAFSPRIEATSAGVCTMDLQAITALGNESLANFETYARTMRARYGEFNLETRVGIAQNPDLAWHAARSMESILVVTNAPEFMASVPVEKLQAAPDILEILNRWGIRTFGELAALGKERLAERLDAEIIELFERATASAPRPLRLVSPPETYEEAIEFEHEIESLEPLLFYLRRFLDQLARRLELAYLVAQELQLKFGLVSGAQYERTFRVPSPTRNVDTLFRMLYTHLENLRTDSPIAAMQLAAKPSPPQARQFTLFETSLRDPNQFSETLARVGALLGSDRIGTPVLLRNHRPEAFCLGPVNFENEAAAGVSVTTAPLGLPLRRFRPAFSAAVETENGQPVFVRFAKFTGAIQRAQGPWRSSGDWWEDRAWERDEWDVQTREGLYRLYREEENWFVEGVYD